MDYISLIIHPSQSFDNAIFGNGDGFRGHKLFMKIKKANEIYEKEFKC